MDVLGTGELVFGGERGRAVPDQKQSRGHAAPINIPASSAVRGARLGMCMYSRSF